MTGVFGTCGTTRKTALVHPVFIGAVQVVHPVQAPNCLIVFGISVSSLDCAAASNYLYHLYHLYQERVSVVIATTYPGTGSGTGSAGGCTTRKAASRPPSCRSFGRLAWLREASCRDRSAPIRCIAACSGRDLGTIGAIAMARDARLPRVCPLIRGPHE